MNEIDYNKQSEQQEEPEKPQIDMLPCRTSSTPWFYAMIVCFFVYLFFTKILMHLLRKAQSNPFSDIDGLSAMVEIDSFLSPLTAFPGIVFIFLFANGCKKLIHNEYKYAITLGCLGIAVEVVSFIGDVSDMNPTISIVTIALLGIAGLVMAVLLTRSFVNNYSGELRYLGICMRDALRFIFIVLCIIVLGVILFLLTDSYGVGMTFIVVAGCLGLYTLYLVYIALRQMNWILEAGHDAQLSDYDLAAYLHDFAPDWSNTNSLQREVFSNKDRNKSKDSRTLSVSSKIIIGVFSVAVLSVLVYLIFDKHSNEGPNNYTEQTIIDEDYEDEYGTEDEYIPSNPEDEYSETASSEATQPAIPDWIPENIRKELISDDFVATNLNGDITKSHNYKGTINEYPITMKLLIHPDGTVTGKYAYDSTLRKYGDSKSSWFEINGILFDSKSGYRRMVFRSYSPDTGNVFEYWDFPDIGTEMYGSMFNIKYIDSPNRKLYEVHLKPEE